MRHTDAFMERLKLKRSVRIWKAMTMLAAAVALVSVAQVGDGASPSGDFIAHYHLEGVMFENVARTELMEEIAENDDAKAFIITIESPGGTAISGQETYEKLREIAEKKPVVAVMRGMAASAAYMTALGADYVLASEGSITGSIGVLMQTVEVTEMAEKLGIKPLTIKSGALKASPSPLEETSPEAVAAVQEVINDFFDYFVALVKKRRKLGQQEVEQIVSGRIFSGKQAVDIKLVDALGGMDDAHEWLAKRLNLPKEDLPIVEVKEEVEPEEWMEENLFSLFGVDFLPWRRQPVGLMALWVP